MELSRITRRKPPRGLTGKPSNLLGMLAAIAKRAKNRTSKECELRLMAVTTESTL
jgi:hypothetical protein